MSDETNHDLGDNTDPSMSSDTVNDLKAMAAINRNITETPKGEAIEYQEDSTALSNLIEKYPPESQMVIATRGEGEGGVEVRLCGEGNHEALSQASENALVQLEQTLGKPLEEVLPGLRIYFADGVIDGGGLALGKENAIILDTSKNILTLDQAEAQLVPLDILEPGDWADLKTDQSTLTAQTTFVHEVGHILDEKVNGHEQSAQFRALNLSEAPTKYGSAQPHEDYAESFMYLVNGKPLENKRRSILLSDIAKATT
ncbi:hypothetical protein H0W80_02455 [Candidatus Saccharibacteria bacterium]|nr:hypothetical protein [Candidatus Saccharibacteria bacterium]